MEFDRAAYLDRIGIVEDVAASEAGLEAIHRAQTYRIPFENFDIQLGRGIPLDPTALCDKMINRARGGYCFELNGLFGLALDEFGFERRPLLARVQVGGQLFPRGHLLNLVRLNDRDWITDVGFGADQLRGPMPLELNRVENFDGQKFRLIDDGDLGITLQTLDDRDWKPLYSFDLGRVYPVDIEMGNYFTSTHPDIFFTWARVATLPKPAGRTTLMDYRLRDINDGTETVVTLTPGEGYIKALEKYFGIVLDEPYDALKPVNGKPPGSALDFSAPPRNPCA
jgi:N-hydroxyarylamine O-acetyltransferase